MNPSLRQLKAVVEIARLRSFTRAAERLHMTQQGLSLAVRELEAQLDCRLFHRTTRAVTLTDEGRRFLPTAEQAVAALEEVGASLAGMAEKSRRTLVVAATPIVAASLLPKACLAFAERRPEVVVRVVDVERTRIQQLVEGGEVDVGFGAFFKPAAGMSRKLIHRCDLVCFSPAGPKRRRGAAMKWRELGTQPLLGLPHDNDVQQLVDAQLASIGRSNEDHPSYRNMQTILAMVEAGFGSAILPSFAMAAASQLEVAVTHLVEPQVPVDFFQVNRKGGGRAAAELDFVQALQQVLTQHCVTPGAAPPPWPWRPRAG
jgi:DNA-binding transcriptional LysR family regulator